MSEQYHTPVMERTATAYLVTTTGGTYVDATAGGGGHTAAILRSLTASGRVIAIDRDPDAVDQIRTRLSDDIASGSLIVREGRFGDLPDLIADFTPVCGLLLDLGVSSHQIDTAERGFSYRFEAPLDMRMDRQSKLTASHIVNRYPESRLKRLLRQLGDVREAARIARQVVGARPIATTSELARIIARCVPEKNITKALARCFQAIRMEVNQEMDELTSVLKAAPRLMRDAGRCVAISYHSGEDRQVKRMFRHGMLTRAANVHPLTGESLSPWTVLTPSPIRPDADELRANKRARSARLRAAERRVLSSITAQT